MTQKNQKTFVVGLDGVPHSLLCELREKRLIPNLDAIFNNGRLEKMSVCVPEISSVSWSSFMTGTQSGEHGIYGFIDVQPGTYKIYFPSFAHLKAKTLWEKLGEKGLTSVVVNMPATYPARETNGVLVSGFVAIDLNRAVYPISLVSELKKIGYRIDVDTVKARQNPDLLFSDLDSTLAGRRRAVELLWEKIDWDLFIVVITGTDRMMHFMWNAYEDENHPYHQHFIAYFRKVDRFVGDLYSRFEEKARGENKPGRFFMLSDHGFTGIRSEVYLNRWLQDNGYLRFDKKNPETIMDIGPGSTAFVIDPSRIYINLKGKYPYGHVAPGDYEKVRSEIKSGLEGLTIETGERIAMKVYRKEDLYQGPLTYLAPDLVVLSRHGFDLKGRVSSGAVFGRTKLQGMHTQDDAFFFSSEGKNCGTIFDAKNLIVNSFSD